MSKQKLTTAEILALARKQNSAGDAEPPKTDDAPAASSEAAEAPASEEPAADAPAAAPKPAASKSAARPKSTKDILAAARAQAKQGAASDEAPAAKPAAAKPAAKSGARPKSTSDILAAARAQAKGGAAAPAPATKAAGSKPAAAKAGATAKVGATAGGERPSVEEMLKAVRGEQPAQAAVPAKPALPPHPKKPAPRAAERPVSRRNFLLALVVTPFALAWTAFSATALFATLGVARFMLPNVLVEPPSKFKIGPPEDYPFGTVSTKWKSEFNIWITHVAYNGQPMIYALSTVCTHLGCTPNWLEGEQKFKCPCHGSGFYPDGVNFEGPAPRPLERYGITLAPDGLLEVDKSVKFQEEMGQWVDAASFFPTA